MPVSWTDRQRRMLTEMGLRVFAPVPPTSIPAATPDPGQPPAEDGAPVRATPPVAAASPAGVPRSPRAAVRSAAAPVTVPTPAPTVPPLGPRPEGVAAMAWPALREAVASCTACGLCHSRTQAVFGTGHPHSRVMVIGEAPGEQEDLKGEPFVGPSGQLLDLMLASIGLGRGDAQAVDADPARQVFIANVLKCRPPRNRNPSVEEVAQCEPFLLRQVALVRPQLILAMGKFAIESILRTTEPVGRLRGRVHRYADVPVVVTYHPAYLLRQPSEKAKAWDDLCLAREVLDTPPVRG
jgi:uracil-DNA glycosylase